MKIPTERRKRILVCALAASLAGWASSLPGSGFQDPRSQLLTDLGVLPRSELERQAWETVAQAPEARRAQLALDFLEHFPESGMQPLAHQFIAIQAFKGTEFEIFERHARLALEGNRSLSELESQLAFYYAESGRYAEAVTVANQLLARLQVEPTPAHPSSIAASQRDSRLLSTVRYVLGRSALGRSQVQEDPASRDTLLGQAVGHLTAALDLNPADDYTAYRLGQAYLAQGNPAKASESLAWAVNLAGFAADPALQTLRATYPAPSGDPDAIDDYLASQEQALQSALQTRPRSIRVPLVGRPHSILWWDSVPESLQQASVGPGPVSNIRFQDYQGPDSCEKCHSTRYQAWSKHSHRWMNAQANRETVKGDFSGQATIQYRGGRGTFFHRDGSYRMRLVRGELQRTYQIERTVGSRFFQYYVGKQIAGPEDRDHPIWTVDHLLPFGYWLDEKQWVPVVHIDAGGEVPDSKREDPFLEASKVPYDQGCSGCHTTRPIGDWMIQTGGRQRLRSFSPHPVSFLISSYLTETHPDLAASTTGIASHEINRIVDQEMDRLPADQHAVTLGISCEACHNGARQHVLRSTERSTSQPPLFFPSSPYLFIEGSDSEAVWGRTSHNLNWICGRCHSGSRPQFAGGMDTWNSTEYSDAIRGFCYAGDNPKHSALAPLRCVDCHDPHYTIGEKWSHTPASDDTRCLRCHQSLQPSEARLEHTHHPADSPGSRCMNCHMPRLNEGMQDVVRTHRIFNPTERKMIEANQPNACNLCHLEKGIDWTLRHLKEWYGKSYSEAKIAANYGDVDASVGLGWLRSSHPATRLVAAEALTQAAATWALLALVDSLDDPYLVNRQFAQRGLERMLDLQLEDFGYHFYMFEEERRGPLSRLRRSIVKNRDGH